MRRALSRSYRGLYFSTSTSVPPAAAAAAAITGTVNYQRPPKPGERVGRIIKAPAAASGIPQQQQQQPSPSLTDVHIPTTVTVADARALVPQPTLETRGFELRRWPLPREPAAAASTGASPAAENSYYPEVEALVKLATGQGRDEISYS